MSFIRFIKDDMKVCMSHGLKTSAAFVVISVLCFLIIPSSDPLPFGRAILLLLVGVAYIMGFIFLLVIIVDFFRYLHTPKID